MLYTLAPELLIGWPRANRPEEREFLLPDVGARPEIGRITGRGNTANLEVVLALKPDLILDVGSTTQTYVSLAERVQEQTGIPYALLDGRFAATAASYRKLGELTRRSVQGEVFGAYTDRTLETITKRIADVAPDKRPRVYYARGPRGLETGLGGSINVETIELLAQNVAGERKGGLATVSIEQVLLWNPDVIITIDRDFAANVKKDPAWIGVAAAQAGRVHLAPKLPFGWVDFPPSVNRLIGLWWLGENSLSRALSGRPARDRDRLLRALLSCDAERCADGRRAGGQGVITAIVSRAQCSARTCGALQNREGHAPLLKVGPGSAAQPSRLHRARDTETEHAPLHTLRHLDRARRAGDRLCRGISRRPVSGVARRHRKCALEQAERRAVRLCRQRPKR